MRECALEGGWWKADEGRSCLMGLLLGSIPLGQQGPPGWGGLCVSSTSSSLARCKGNVPVFPCRGNIPRAGRRVPMLELVVHTPGHPWLQCGWRPTPPWNHLWSQMGSAPPPGWKTLTFTKREIKTAGHRLTPHSTPNKLSFTLQCTTHGHLPWEVFLPVNSDVITLHGSYGISKGDWSASSPTRGSLQVDQCWISLCPQSLILVWHKVGVNKHIFDP